MKKLISIFLISILLLAVVGCVCGSSQTTVTHRGELSIAYDNALTKELLAFFQANQDCIVSGSLLNEQTDYQKLSGTTAVALVKDEAIAEKLRAEGWTDTENWTDKQKETNAQLFGFTVLLSPKAATSDAEASKILTDWLVGDGTYEKTVSTAKSCGCGSDTSTIRIKSDAPALAKSEQFSALKAN